MIILLPLLGLLLIPLVFGPGILLGMLLVVTVISFFLFGLIPTIFILLLLFLTLFVFIPMITEFVILIKKRYRRFKARQDAMVKRYIKN